MNEKDRTEKRRFSIKARFEKTVAEGNPRAKGRRFRFAVCMAERTLAALCLLATVAIPAAAQTFSFSPLHSFTGSDGNGPQAGLLMDKSGNLYGTSAHGGSSAQQVGVSGHGTVFELVNSAGTYSEKVLYNFTGGLDGGQPFSGLVTDASGDLYGTTSGGGASGLGTVFELVNSAGTYSEKVLYSFAGGSDGDIPWIGLVRDGSGNLYGTTLYGGGSTNCGSGCGTVFELVNASGSYSEKVLYSFAGGTDGARPYASLVIDSSGNLYGTTEYGGASQAGIAFELIKSAGQYSEKLLYTFTGGTDGAGPDANLIMDSSGDLFGMTAYGGASDSGAVYELVNSGGTFTEKVLYSFAGGSDGSVPQSGLLMDASGDLYGTTVQGGASCTDTAGCGIVFELVHSSGSYTERVLHRFTGGSDGAYPYEGVIEDSSGNLYGTAYAGGSNNDGTVYELPLMVQGRAIFVSPASLSFSGQPGTTTAPQSALVTNIGAETVSFTGISLSGPNADQFSQTNNCGIALAAGMSCTISVSFTPSAVGSASATLTISDDAPSSPQTIGLSGTGATLAGGTPLASLSTASLYLGAAPVGGTSGTLTLTLTNDGNASLNLSSDPAVSGPFTVSNNTCASGTSLLPGTNCTVDVTFNPVAPQVARGTLTFADNASPGTQTVYLTGAGVNEFHMCVYTGTPPDPNDQEVPHPYFDNTENTCYYGCALTSTGTLLTAFDGSVTPKGLDSYLTADTTDPGYVSGQLIPNGVVGFMNNRVQLIQRLSPAPGHLTVDSAALNQYLSQHVLDPNRLEVVILHLCFTTDGITCGEDHYVGVLGPTDSTMTNWNVFEPAWRTATPQASLSTLSGHLNGFVDPNGNKVQFLVLGAGGYEQSSVSSGFGVVAESPVELLITDPQGRRLGNLSNGQDVFEIPLGSYDREFLVGNDNGTSTGTDPGEASGIKIAYVPTPLNGTYTVAVTGTASGSYTLHFKDVMTDGSTQETTVTGTTSVGATATYTVSYSSNPGSPFTVTAQPDAVISPASMNIGSEVVGSRSAAQAVTLSNTGNAPLTISNIAASSDFAETNDCGSQVNAAASCTVNVTFTPTAGGTRTGTLTITDNASGSPQTVALTGTGEDFAIAVPSGSSSSATLSPGQSANYTLSISPEGGFNQAVALSCTGAPSRATCSVSPASATLNGTNATTVTVTVATTAPALGFPLGNGRPLAPPLAIWVTLVGLIGLSALWLASSGRKARVGWLAPLGLIVLVLVLCSSCSGGGPQAPSGSTGTAAGTYTLTVTGTSGSLSHSTPLTLSVQ